MSRDQFPSNRDHRSAAEWFVELDRECPSEPDASELAAWLASDDENEAAFDRCQAAALLTSRLRGRSGVRWAFREAADLAAGRLQPRGAAPTPRWYQRPGPAWAVAGLATAVAAAALLPFLGLHGPERLETRGAQQLVGAEELVDAAEPAPSIPIDVPYHEPAALLPGEVVVDARSVAVLPFRWAMPEPSDGRAAVEEIAAALNDTVVRQLSALPGVYVVADQSVAGFTGDEFEAEDIAVQLGVRGVVEGWMDTEAGRVRLRLRLTDAANATVIDTTFDHPLESLSTMQSDVVRTITRALDTAPRSEARPASFSNFGETR